MFVTFETLPDSARIWIYQSSRKFSDSEEKHIQKTVETFCEGWNAHGAPIRGSVKIFHRHFIVLAADESFNSTSGCSIDTTLRLFQEIEASVGCSLLDRTLIAFMEKEDVMVYPQKELKHLFSTGILNKSSLAFNNVVATKGELRDKWLLPAEKMWISRFLPKDSVAT